MKSIYECLVTASFAYQLMDEAVCFEVFFHLVVFVMGDHLLVNLSDLHDLFLLHVCRCQPASQSL